MGNSGSAADAAEGKKAEAMATQHAGMYLRSSSTHLLTKSPYLAIGSHPTEKIYFFVNSNERTKEERLMAMVKKPELSALDLKVEANKVVFCGLLEGLKHPYILPALEVDYIAEKEFLVMFRPLSRSGSIRDLVHSAKPRDPYIKKYAKSGKQFSLRLIREYGRQILEALLFLRSRKIPYSHLHSGNVILDREKKTCRLTDIENALLGISPRYEKMITETPAASEVDAEVLCFGHVLYEMAVGFELSSPILDCIPPHCYREVGEVLERIFNPSGEDGLTSVKALLRHPLFAEVVLKEDLTDVSGPLDPKEKEVLKLAKKGGGGDGKEKKKKKKSHSSKTVGSTLTPEDAAWAGGVEQINNVRAPTGKKYFTNEGDASCPPPRSPAPVEPAVPAQESPADNKGGRGATAPVAAIEEQTAAPAAPSPQADPAPAAKGKGGKGKGKGPPMGRGPGLSAEKLAKLGGNKKPAADMSADAAAGATMDALSSLGSPEAVLAMLKKKKTVKPKKENPKLPKREMTMQEQLAAKVKARKG